MAITRVLIQNLMLPRDEFPAALFVRDGLAGQNPANRSIPDYGRWNFAYADGKLVRDDRPPRAAEPDPSPFAVVDGELVIPAGATADFSCYYNMLSSRKWLEYTAAQDFVLELELSGEAQLEVSAYQLGDIESREQARLYSERLLRGLPEEGLARSQIGAADLDGEGYRHVEFPVGHPDATLVGFSIVARTEVRIRRGGWCALIDDGCLREVDLCIATTTFQKEEFITRNVRAYQQMMAQDAEMADHLRILVVDNGRTLNGAELADERTHVFGNDNAGGAGGFARGMMEALRLERRPTHIIIMDDDVLVLPEALKRTYVLLRMLKPEWQDSFISGAMLRLENRDIQHEDIGYIDRYGFFAPKKPSHRVSNVVDCAFNEVGWPDYGHEYAAWWYCCIPMSYVRPDSLPAPLFIRGDDVEFSMRSSAPIISLNGIGVWHMGFGGKFSAQMEYYQVLRNSLIVQAFHPECSDVAFMTHCEGLFNGLICEFAYDYAELVLDAVQDYLSGPEIIEQPRGLEIIREKGKRNEQLVPLEDLIDGDVDFSQLFDFDFNAELFQVIRRKLTTLGLNGQLFFESKVGEHTGFAPYDWEYLSYPLEGARRIVSVNPNDLTGTVRERDPERFKQVVRRKLALFDRYKAENERVSAAYREAYPRLTSEEFWRAYLRLDEAGDEGERADA